MPFEKSIEKVIGQRSANAFGGHLSIEPKIYSLQRFDFTDGETTEGILYTAPASVHECLEDFVASALDKVIDVLGYDRSQDDLDDVLALLSGLRFDSPDRAVRKSLIEHLLPKYSGHNLSYYDCPNVDRIADIRGWILPASFGCVLSSGDFNFMYYWFCTG